MAYKIKIHGYKEEFKSKSEAIRFLLKEGKLENKIIAQKVNCTSQHICIESKKYLNQELTNER